MSEAEAQIHRRTHPTAPRDDPWSPVACARAARKRRTGDWVARFLTWGPSVNPGLRQGLAAQPRIWIGPLTLSPGCLSRCCGPEPGTEYPEDAEIWYRRTRLMARHLRPPEAIPPLIAEWRRGTLSLRDGNHRHAAMMARGIASCYVLVWCNTRADSVSARAHLRHFMTRARAGDHAKPHAGP